MKKIVYYTLLISAIAVGIYGIVNFIVAIIELNKIFKIIEPKQAAGDPAWSDIDIMWQRTDTMWYYWARIMGAGILFYIANGLRLFGSETKSNQTGNRQLIYKYSNKTKQYELVSNKPTTP